MRVLAKKIGGLIVIRGLSDEGVKLVKQMLVGVLSEKPNGGCYDIKALDIKEQYRTNFALV